MTGTSLVTALQLQRPGLHRVNCHIHLQNDSVRVLELRNYRAQTRPLKMGQPSDRKSSGAYVHFAAA